MVKYHFPLVVKQDSTEYVVIEKFLIPVIVDKERNGN